ncbi:helix-turn-helix transcriptional regulator [Chryseolinea soli]|uniref:AraC family transcriptional regulator n=1 Tax=Chryseolinea soli TaxID=2321403 RepID=A0A385SWH9_9BACT|nr:helix-turn-helix domain-containing protein [Chryseolinea soli]AYB34080.1 AraC family transcriptional regulator [Chryseolinea soli]
MRYQETLPPPALSDVVRYFWSIESDDVPVAPVTYRLFAESAPGLVFFYHYNAGLVSGITHHHRDFAMPGKLGMMGAFLYPYALPFLFHESPQAVTNTTVAIADFLGNEGTLLKDEIANAQHRDARIVALSRYLLRKLKSRQQEANGLFQCIQHIVRYKGATTVDALASDLGLSGRHFDRKFRSAVGTSPKAFSRLIRFHSSLSLRKGNDLDNLTALALQAGYYDQSHFIRDFKEFSGLSPKQYFNLNDHHTADNFIKLSA